MFSEDALIHSLQKGFVIDHPNLLLIHEGKEPFFYHLRELYHFVQSTAEFLDCNETIIVTIKNLKKLKK